MNSPPQDELLYPPKTLFEDDFPEDGFPSEDELSPEVTRIQRLLVYSI